MVEVAETCELAVERIEWLKTQRQLAKGESLSDNPYNSVDPAPPSADASSLSTEELKKILVNEDLPLFRRYRSMFELRNRGGSEAVAALCAGLHCKDSALFRHEIAYVLGQMQHPESLEALEAALIRDDENEMVRIGSFALRIPLSRMKLILLNIQLGCDPCLRFSSEVFD